MQYTLPKLIRDIGLRTSNSLYAPKLLDINDLSYPKDSSILWYNSPPMLSNPMLKNLRNPVSYIVPLMTENGIGSYKKSTLSYNKVVLKHKDIEPNIEYIINPNKLLSISKQKDILLDYSELNNLYMYRATRDKVLAELRNPLLTMIEDSVKNNYLTRIEFLPLEVPNIIPKYEDVVKMLKYDNFRIIPLMEDFNFYPHYEIIKCFFTEYKEKSIFNLIKDVRIHPLYILPYKGNSVTLLQLGEIFSMSKDNEISINRFNKYNPKELLKLYLRYLVYINMQNPKSKIEITGTDDVNSKDIDLSNIDSLIEENNEKFQTIEEIEVEEIKDSIDIYQDEPYIKLAEDALTFMKDRGIITQKDIENRLELVKENIKVSEEFKLSNEDVKRKYEKIDIDTIFEENMKVFNTKVNNKYYRKHILHKHLKRTLLSLSKAGLPITDIEEVKVDNLSNRRTTYILTVKQLSGNPVKLPIHIPLPDEEGYYRVNGSEYKMTMQRLDTPIKKTRMTEVVLSSYYGKLFLQRGLQSSHNLAKFLSKQLSKASSDIDSPINMYVAGFNQVLDKSLPYIYTSIGRETRSFVYKDIFFLFAYKERDTLLNKNVDLNKIEKHGILFGSSNKYYYVIKDDDIYKVDSNGNILEELGNFLKFIGIEETPYEYITIKILGDSLPIAIPLLYYVGMKKLLRDLKIKYKFQSNKKDIPENSVLLKFEDGYLVMDGSNPYSKLIVGSLIMFEKVIKGIPFKLMDIRDTIKDILSLRGIDLRVAFELDILKSMFIDPMTEDVLKEMKEPTTLRPLLIRACELLKDDTLPDPRDITTFVFKNDERLIGMLYNGIAKAARENFHKLGRVRTRFTIDPYVMYKYLTSDAAFNLAENINPIEALKQDEETTLLGMFGRTSDTITDKDREFHPSMVGVLSEATKDNANVGITTYLSANPRLKNNIGLVDKDRSNLSPANVYSTSLLTAPAGLKDDGKRGLYVSIQNKHIVAGPDYIVIPYRTGEEAMVPYRMDKKFCLHAEEDGEVLDVTKNRIVIKYKDRKETYKLKSWIGKEEGGKTYRHILTTNLKKGDKIKKHDNIYYDSLYFGEDIFNRKRVCLKTGILAHVAHTEAEDSFEDSSNISKKLADRLHVPLTYVKDKILPVNINIEDIKKIGDKVTYNDNLMVFRNINDITDIPTLSETGKKILEDISANRIKAEAKGKIVDIELYYNPPNPDSEVQMTDSVKKLILEIDKSMKEKYGKSGEVDNTFSIRGSGLEEGSIYIKFYIEKSLGMHSGDKFRVGNQLKTTVANIFNKIETKSGIELDGEIGLRGVSARIVDSPYVMGEVNMILEHLQKQFLKDLRE